jgi:surface antigen
VTSHAPQVGDIAQWAAWPGNPYGHVAYVAAVYGDGTILVYEYNWSSHHRFDTRRIPASVPTVYLRF